MKDRILKWWNRKWSDWEHYNDCGVYSPSYPDRKVYTERIFVSTSNDGLQKFKKVRIT